MSAAEVFACAHGVQVGVSYGLVYPLTACCGASATGSVDCVACRSCYAEVNPVYGDCTPQDDLTPVRGWLAELGCATPAACLALLAVSA